MTALRILLALAVSYLVGGLIGGYGVRAGVPGWIVGGAAAAVGLLSMRLAMGRRERIVVCNWIAVACERLSYWFGGMGMRFATCPDCGRNRYTGEPCSREMMQ